MPALELGNTGGEENAVGTIVALKERRVRDLEIVEASMRDDDGVAFAAKWIGRRRFVYGRLHEGMRLYVRGRVERNLAHPVVNVAQYAILGAGETYRGEIGAGVSRQQTAGQPQDRRRRSRQLCDVARRGGRRRDSAGDRADVEAILSLEDAYRAIHRPADPQQASETLEIGFVFAEFLTLATGAQLRRLRRERETDARQLHVDPEASRSLKPRCRSQ